MDELLQDYQRLQAETAFTDFDLMTGDGKKISAHSLVLACSSDFIRHWMEHNPTLNNLHVSHSCLIQLEDFRNH